MKHLKNMPRKALENLLQVRSNSDLEERSKILEYTEPSVIKTDDPNEIVYNYRSKLLKNDQFDKTDYLSIYTLSNGEFEFTTNNSNVIEYSINGNTWTEYSSKIICGTNDTIRLRGDNACYNGDRIKYSGSFILYGNTDSLINSDESVNFLVSSYNNNVFYELFKNNDSLISIKNLVINANSTSCCYGMFQHCRRLVDVLDLLKAPISTGAYEYMFAECYSLNTASNLTINAKGNYCCHAMFYECTNLTSIPTLKTVVAGTPYPSHLYDSMFYECYNLENAGITITLHGSYACYRMFYNCHNLKVVPKLIGDQANGSCCREMFYNCTSLETIPEYCLENIYLYGQGTNYFFYQAFANCTKLREVKRMPRAYNPYSSACAYMFSNCTSLKKAAPIRCWYSPAGQSAFQYMYRNCISLEEYTLIPWVNSNTNYMFSGCSSLSKIIFVGTFNGTTTNWLSGVAPNGIFYYDGTDGASSIPQGWSVQPVPFGEFGIDYYVPSVTPPTSNDDNEGWWNWLEQFEMEPGDQIYVQYKSGRLGRLVCGTSSSYDSYDFYKSYGYSTHDSYSSTILSKAINDGVTTYYNGAVSMLPIKKVFTNWKDYLTDPI